VNGFDKTDEDAVVTAVADLMHSACNPNHRCRNTGQAELTRLRVSCREAVDSRRGEAARDTFLVT
jgi:hypothetical protein